MTKSKIIPQKHCTLSEPDRLMLAQLLVKAGYSVRLGREKQGAKSAYVHYVECWGCGYETNP